MHTLHYILSKHTFLPSLYVPVSAQVVAWRLLQNQLPLSVDLQWALSCLCLALQQPCVWNKLSTAEYATHTCSLIYFLRLTIIAGSCSTAKNGCSRTVMGIIRPHLSGNSIFFKRSTKFSNSSLLAIHSTERPHVNLFTEVHAQEDLWCPERRGTLLKQTSNVCVKATASVPHVLLYLPVPQTLNSGPWNGLGHVASQAEVNEFDLKRMLPAVHHHNILRLYISVDYFQGLKCSLKEKGSILGYFNGLLCVGYIVHTHGHLTKAALPEKGLHLVAGGQQGPLVDREIVCGGEDMDTK
ncbi:hypothetical protein F7725_015977 [Dissostichus mawsoni]|uniref:Uncharacterized protein n=1 Tax=Dissostichus mawsoni TaxID=36200 RepID=A0A7J5Y566_DISMA|nr:hypothetical protein F7725_015977 [Dissostichus mawsoni]